MKLKLLQPSFSSLPPITHPAFFSLSHSNRLRHRRSPQLPISLTLICPHPRAVAATQLQTQQQPVTNSLSRSLCSHPTNDMVASLRQLQLNKIKTMPYSWVGLQIGVGSPRVSMIGAAFCSLPSTPTMLGTRTGIGLFDLSEDEGRYC